MNNRIWAAITFHDPLHSFRQGLGVVMATMKEKLDQKLKGMVHKLI